MHELHKSWAQFFRKYMEKVHGEKFSRTVALAVGKPLLFGLE